MISKKTKTAINNATTVSPKKDQVSPPSDIKIIYGPLLKYGAVALGIVAVIITAAVLTERKVENFNNELALAEPKPIISANSKVINEVIETPELIISHSINEQPSSGTESQLKTAETAETTVTAETAETTVTAVTAETAETTVTTVTTVTAETAETSVATIEKTAVAEITTVAEVATTESDTNQIEANAKGEEVSAIFEASANQIDISTEETVIEEPLAADSTAEDIQAEADATVIEVSTPKPNKLTANTVITAQYRDNMLKRDQQQLAQIKRNHERNIASLRSNSGHQNTYLEQNIKQMEQNYQKHIDAIKRSQEFRNSMNNQI